MHYQLERFIKKMAGLALAGLFSLSCGSAMAVELNPNGLGQALIYPYYNAQESADGGAYNTLLSVVNHTADAKAVRVNIREGKAGELVLSFNLFLAPYDTWVAVIAPDDQDRNVKNARIITWDRSCTYGDVLAMNPAGKTFLLPGPSLTGFQPNMREGYIEMIEMATIPSEMRASSYLYSTMSDSAERDCGRLSDMAKIEAIGANTGGLSGHLTLINVQSGFSFNARAIALDKFAKAGAALGYFDAYDDSGRVIDLTSAEPISVVSGVGDEAKLISHWEPGTADAVSAVLMHQQVVNEYVTMSETVSQTAWVMTFPTKPYYYETLPTSGSQVRKVSKLFQRNMSKDGEACDDLSTISYGREEEAYPEECLWSGCPVNPPMFCRASNTMGFRINQSGEIFSGEANNWYSNSSVGYANIAFGEKQVFSTDGSRSVHQLTNNRTTVIRADGTVSTDQTRSYYGLPMVGFAVQTYTNASINLPDGKVGRSIYGVTVPHSYRNKSE